MGRGQMARRFRFGICTDQNMTWEKNVERWQWFEQLGFESAWGCDHLDQPTRPQGPCLAAWTLLAARCARTSRLGLGGQGTAQTLGPPPVLATQDRTVHKI